MWQAKILVNWQPFANVLPANILSTLIYSIGGYFYNFIKVAKSYDPYASYYQIHCW